MQGERSTNEADNRTFFFPLDPDKAENMIKNRTTPTGREGKTAKSTLASAVLELIEDNPNVSLWSLIVRPPTSLLQSVAFSHFVI